GNIAFVKTHKTGSTSSMVAILYRYAVRHSLKVCMLYLVYDKGTSTYVLRR
ncbi:unnamed protein product, partial [Laminaria digitata]